MTTSTRLNRSHWVTLRGHRRRAGLRALPATPTSVWPHSPERWCWLALRVADHDQAIRKMPWTPILMVSGVSVLVALLEKTGGLDLFTELLAQDCDARLTHWGHRLRDRRHLRLQQHVRRRAAGVPADRARPDRTTGRRPVRRRLVDEHRRASRGHVAALDDGRDVHRRDQRTRNRSGRPTTSSSCGACR